jgi:mevalonate kinase
MKYSAFAPGKVIIIGDHTIVHAGKGYVVPLSRGVEVTLKDGVGKITSNFAPQKAQTFIEKQLEWFSENISPIKSNLHNFEINLQIPVSAGLGSSTAVITALFKALLDSKRISYTDQLLYKFVTQAESVSYPISGIDQSSIVYQQPLLVEKTSQGNLLFENTNLDKQLAHFMLVDSGSATETTGEMVAIFAESIKQNPDVFKEMLALTEKFVANLKKSNFSYEVLQTFGDKLIEMNVVGKKAVKMIEQLKKMGVGAKATAGAGYKTGSGMLLVWHQDKEKLESFLQLKKWDYFPLVN